MKRFLKTHNTRSRFLGIPGVLALLFLVLGVWIAARGPARAQAIPNGTGFLWTDTFGWISLNCQNDWDDNAATDPTSDCLGPGGGYGITVVVQELRGTISGQAWSPHLGLVCFGSTCGEGEPDATFDLGNTVVVNGQNIAPVTGRARIEAHRNEGGLNQGGWINLDAVLGFSQGVGARIANGQVQLSGFGWQRNTNNTGAGLIFFGPPPEITVPTGGGGGGGRYVPGFESDVNNGCHDRQDNDEDENPGRGVALPPFSRRDCLDPDCKNLSSFSRTYQPAEDFYHCGPVIRDESILSPLDCFDGKDNDWDALIDGADPDCLGQQNPDDLTQIWRKPEYKATEYNLCSDGFDNDNDGKQDCDDEDCKDNFSLCKPTCLCPMDSNDSAKRTCVAGAIGPNPDFDGDGIRDFPPGIPLANCDNCKNDPNPDQHDSDADGKGDACDPVPWLETREGALYLKSATGTAPPIAKRSATFCIFATGDIGPLTSSAECPQKFDGVKASKLPRFDVQGLKNGKYGNAAIVPLKSLLGLLRSNVLDSANLESAVQVYYHTGDLVIDNELTFFNGAKGAKLILVENGTLTINKNVLYDGTPESNPRHLASVGFLVIGTNANAKIVIDPEVTQLRGTYVTTGIFETGALLNQLKIDGLVAAHQFKLQRQYPSPQEGAEVISYDGRAVLNPPPGFADLVKGLPQFRTVAPK